MQFKGMMWLLSLIKDNSTSKKLNLVAEITLDLKISEFSFSSSYTTTISIQLILKSKTYGVPLRSNYDHNAALAKKGFTILEFYGI